MSSYIYKMAFLDLFSFSSSERGTEAAIQGGGCE